MFASADDRLIAETAWLESWEEMQLDDHLIELWNEAQVKADRVNDEALALVAEGSTEEIPF